MEAYSVFLDIHSILRWLILIFILATIFKTLTGWLGDKPFTNTDNRLSLISMIFLHLQFVIGIILYYISPYVQFGNMKEVMSSDVLRFWTVEHILIMLIGIILVTMGRIKAKKSTSSWKKHKTTAIYFLIGLILILSRIPWPFMSISREWF